ncbi:MAG TPA: helix-turn-helix domain-containing protein [Fimbriimonadales bacterium]|nr:helix-turn-helix domain-containing protein [Fimbriimonadales bacterium]
MPKKFDDPIEYIENAFLDITKEEDQKTFFTQLEENLPEDITTLPKILREPTEEQTPKKENLFQKEEQRHSETIAVQLEPAPSIAEKITEKISPPPAPQKKPSAEKKGQMQAPRPRKRRTPVESVPISSDLEKIIQQAPKNLKFLSQLFDDNITQKYYSTRFKESREELIRNLIDPELTLEETARLLGVCPATVRRYTNRNWLKHHRTAGNQRRFRLSGIVEFVEKHGRHPE